MSRRCALLLAIAVILPVASCAVNEVMPAPRCLDGGAALLAAQAVPTASQVPCLEPLPNGWEVRSVRVDQDGTIVTLDSDRAGDDAATLRFASTCDVSEAVPAPSELPPAERFDQIDRLEPGLRASRYYVFEGGCVSWRFEFDDGTSATEAVAIGEALSLISRQALNDNIRETFIDEEI